MATLQIKRRTYYWVLLLLLYMPASGQVNFYGKVIDDFTDKPIPDASVYFNNTTIGTETNQGGEFTLVLPDLLLNTGLVISCSGYEVFLYKPALTQVTGKKFVFKIHAREPETQNKLQPSAELKKRWLGIFYNNVLGISEEAAKSTISNEGSIYFVAGLNKTSFIAYADTPLVIINPMLGFKISFDLSQFWYDQATGQSEFSGYARYDEMGDSKKYVKNRSHCFYGSSLHFYRSLIANQLQLDGFGIFLQLPFSDSLKEQSKRAGALLLPEEQSKIIPVRVQEVLYIDSTNNFSLKFTGRLLVQYRKNPFSKRYLSRNAFAEGLLPGGVETYLTIKPAMATGINSAGVLSDPTAITYEGYWMYERLANTLPYDYKPE